jgi:hypothetical protein
LGELHTYGAWNDWLVVHHLKNEENYDSTPPTLGRWEKYRIGWVKCNVDAVFLWKQG